MMNEIVLLALAFLQASTLTYSEWLAVGMALKEEGFDWTVWDSWSQDDTRYKPGECERKWESFDGSVNPVTGGTIIQMAKDRGWDPPKSKTEALEWDDIVIDMDDSAPAKALGPKVSPTAQLEQYIRLIFRPDEIVGYCTNDAVQDEEGKWRPTAGVNYQTAEQLIQLLHQYPNDLGATVGDCKPDAGGWIRYNPVDGAGVKEANVTRFTYALLECDDIPKNEQIALFRRLQIPITALIDSGGRSIHALVKVEAEDLKQYKERVAFLYAYLKKQGVPIDTANRNPNRFTRMPGIMRGDHMQTLLATDIGCSSWDDWLELAEDDLPDIISLAEIHKDPPMLPDELIQGILRIGHKMLLAGSSKAGKSFLLMELCLAIAGGLQWLGHKCRQGRVLYINLEIDPASCYKRFCEIYDTLGLPYDSMRNIDIWNLRGHAVPLDQLVPRLIRRIQGQNYMAVVLDPIYKVITGDENNATEMSNFCNQFDKICAAAGCATIYCHHHSKGSQGAKRSMDRASGSGVFARDPDALLDMIELELPAEMKEGLPEDATAWRMESSLREFPNIKPTDFVFSFPIHILDENGLLEDCPAQGTSGAGRLKNSRSKTTDEAEAEFRAAFDRLSAEGQAVDVNDMAKAMGVQSKTVYARRKALEDEFSLEAGKIMRVTMD